MDIDGAQTTFRSLWHDLGGDPQLAEATTFTGSAGALASPFDVTGFASACVAAAATAVAELAALRRGSPAPAVVVDREAASAAFRYEALARPEGWELPPVWDPVAGDYEAADGWIRLHTNYAHHLDAVLAVLGVPAERSEVAAAVARWKADELEAAVVGAGGCAAAMRTEEAWDRHPAGVATAGERPMVLAADLPGSATGPTLAELAPGGGPLAGVRVLDLTRVIAGPTGTRYLAAHGADVLRIDPPGFDEVPALLPEVTAGKRCAALDLRSDVGRDRFGSLVAEAHVVVGGLRPGAMAGLGWAPEDLRRLNPTLVTVTHDASGWSGPWAGRRGFDSLVQMSTGIAATGQEVAGAARPTPLPAQALDHGVGHLVAAAACRGLMRLLRDGVAGDARGSLVGAANVVRSLRRPDEVPAGPVDLAARATEPAATAWGPMRRVPLAGAIEGARPATASRPGRSAAMTPGSPPPPRDRRLPAGSAVRRHPAEPLGQPGAPGPRRRLLQRRPLLGSEASLGGCGGVRVAGDEHRRLPLGAMGLEGRHPRVQVAVLDGLDVVGLVGLEEEQRRAGGAPRRAPGRSAGPGPPPAHRR
ncbi:MAG: CoA transferase [Acidimicrobiales bacterium]